MTAILTNGENWRTLFLIKSLAKQNINLFVGSQWKYPLTSFSKYKHQRFIYASPKNQYKFIKSLLNLSAREGILIPISTTETYTIAKFRKKLEKKFRIPIDTFQKIMFVQDKSHLTKLALDYDVKIPKTYIFDSIKKVKEFSNNADFPFILKLRKGTGGKGITFVKDKKSLISTFQNLIKTFKLKPREYPLIQEYIPGQIKGCAALANQGDIRAIFTYKSIREYPPLKGISSFKESTKDKDLMKITKKIIKSLGWHGLIHLDFIVSKDRGPLLLDINPRVWTSINLPIQAGLDFPSLLYKMALDGDVQKVNSYKVGLKSVILSADILAFPHYLINHDIRLKDSLNFSLTFDDFSVSDPLPFLTFFYYHLKNRFTKKGVVLF